MMKTNLHISQLIVLTGLFSANIALAQTPLPEMEPVDPVLLEELEVPPLLEEAVTTAENEQTVESPPILPEELPAEFLEVLFVIDEEPEIVEPEPTFEDLLTPEIQQTVELNALNADIKGRKDALKQMENKLDRMNAKQELIETRQEKIALREEKLNARQDKLDLKRDEIEAKLADPDLKSEKRKRLETKLGRITERESRIDKRLVSLEVRGQKLEEKLERLQQHLIDLGEELPADIDPDELVL